VKQKWVLMTEEIPSEEETTTAEVSVVRRKCTLQFVLTVVVRLRYLSGQTLTDQSIAENAFLTTGSLERTAINSYSFKNFTFNIQSVLLA
jgi:hypothetical protein